jgi:phage terminase large subunit-like protein
MEDTYKDITSIIDKIGELRVFPPLVWVWSWDVASTMWRSYMEGEDPDYCTAMDLDEVWELFWTQADKNGFTLEYGVEDLDDSIRDWLMEIGAVELYDGEDEEDEDEDE